jgi:hypothetical protein
VKEALGCDVDVRYFANDAFLSALGEVRHPRGRAGKPREQHGRLPPPVSLELNVGSGLCAGWLTPNAEYDPLGSIGRWLYIDTVTGEFTPRKPERAFLAPNDFDEGGLRASLYFSFGSVALRWFHSLKIQQGSVRAALLQDCGFGELPNPCSTKDFAASAMQITQDPQRYPRFKFLRGFNERLANDVGPQYAATYDFLAGYASDLASCVRQLEHHRPDTKFTDVILTGSLGENLGRAGERDLLAELMGQLLPGRGIYRSRIATSIMRELAGVLALAESPDSRSL